MQVKLFWIDSPTGAMTFMGRKTGSNAVELERKINSWLSENQGIEIVHIKQSASGGSFGPSLWLVSVWFTSLSGM